MQFSCCVYPVHKHHTMEIKFHIFLTLALDGKSSSVLMHVFCDLQSAIKAKLMELGAYVGKYNVLFVIC
jgi:hypothetical protein